MATNILADISIVCPDYGDLLLRSHAPRTHRSPFRKGFFAAAIFAHGVRADGPLETERLAKSPGDNASEPGPQIGATVECVRGQRRERVSSEGWGDLFGEVF